MSFLGKLISSLFSGIHVGDKYENNSTHDSAPKQNVSGINNSANMTIGTNNSYSYRGQQNTNNIEGVQVVINGPCELNMSTTSKTASSIHPLSEQAKSIMITMAESGEERFATLELAEKLEEIHMINTNKSFPINDGIAILEGIDSLVGHGYLKHSEKRDSGNLYVLTTKGRDYGKRLLEENRGNTAK